MKRTNRIASTLSLLLASALFASAFAPIAHGQVAALGNTSKSLTPLLRKMVGAWDVQQRMWPGPNAEAIDLPPAVAQRRLVEDAYLQAITESAQESGQDSFTRTAYINYNPVSRQYEYFSVDSRAPQQMHYQSERRDNRGTDAVKLRGGLFVASQWGNRKNVEFKYRLVLGEVKDDLQVVRVYLTPQSEANSREFLAFEYVYTRQL